MTAIGTGEQAEELLVFAGDLADTAAAITLPTFRQPLAVSAKADTSPVTEADRAAEAAMRERIRRQYPAHGIIGEEYGMDKADADYVWVLDPIDGTRSFISGSPLYCTLIALVHNGQPCIGIIDVPALAERWSGIQTAAKRGSWHSRDGTGGQGTTIRPLPETGLPLAEAVMATTTLGVADDGRDRQLRQLQRAAGQVRLGGDAYSYGCLASGYCHLVAEYGMQPYDYLPLVPIVQGAGGIISDWRGAALTPASGDSGVLASCGKALHEAAQAVLNAE